MSSENGMLPSGLPRPPRVGGVDGAVDLAMLKHAKGDPDIQAEHEREQMRQNGLLCKCGQRIEDLGVELIATWKGVIPTPVGAQDGGACVTARFCSEVCAEFVQARLNGLEFTINIGPQASVQAVAEARATRKAAVSWIESRHTVVQSSPNGQ